MVNLLILESNDGDSFDELAGDTAATLSFVAALRSFILSIAMELAVECRGNVVGNLFFIRREFQQCNQFLFSALSRVFAKSIMLWPPAYSCERESCFSTTPFLNCVTFFN
jgi:hypothetical protein